MNQGKKKSSIMYSRDVNIKRKLVTVTFKVIQLRQIIMSSLTYCMLVICILGNQCYYWLCVTSSLSSQCYHPNQWSGKGSKSQMWFSDSYISQQNCQISFNCLWILYRLLFLLLFLTFSKASLQCDDDVTVLIVFYEEMFSHKIAIFDS